MPGKKLISAIVTGAALVVALGSLITGCSSLPENAAVQVNGDIITKDQVAERIRVARGLSPSEVPADPESEEFINYQKDVTQQLLWEQLVKQEADKRGLTVSDEEIEAGVQAYVEDKFLGDAQKMEEQYALRGITTADLRADIQFKLLLGKVRESLMAEVEVTEDEVRADYDRNINKYVYPEKRQVRQIVSASEADAQAALTRVNNGEAFPAVATAVSTDASTKGNGGLLGLVTRESLPPEVGDTVFTMGINEVSQPLSSGGKWYVVKVELISPASNLTFEAAKEELMYYKKNQKFSELFKEFKAGLYDSADIEYAGGYEPRDSSTPAETVTTPGNAPADSIDIQQ